MMLRLQMNAPAFVTSALSLAFLLHLGEPGFGYCPDRKEATASAQVDVHADQQGCAVDLDADEIGVTDRRGDLVFAGVEPGDHYLHVRCSGRNEQAFFLSPHPGERLELQAANGKNAQASTPPMGLEAAQARIELQQAIQRALHLRAAGSLEEAVALLRQATRLDPENPDLHRELGITLLLGKDWKRARIEMIEAVRHDPQNADAHNGLGYALEKLGELEAALKEYRTATQLEPDNLSYLEHYVGLQAKLAGLEAQKLGKRKK
jgi:tetratricopeptide (TPR) repeat protein